MGRRINSIRQISKDRVRNPKTPRSKILIALEGKNKTEKTYFENFDRDKKTYSILIAKGDYTDPLNLVKKLSEEIKKIGLDKEYGDAAYCVFDTDTDVSKNKAILEAIDYAHEHGIVIITSSPCVELWFLLHETYTAAKMDNVTVLKKLKKYYPRYEKNYNMYPEIFAKTSTAICNAKKLEAYQLSNNQKIGMVETNPNTEIYKIVEDLIKRD